MNLTNIKGHTLDAKTIILAVEDDNSGSGYDATGGDTEGFLMSITTQYATDSDRTGLPIFSSAGGSYYDEGGEDRVCRIDVVNVDTDAEIEIGGNTIYAKFHDAADHAGTGDGTDVYARFYANNAVTTISGYTVKFVYPHRKVMSNMQEWEWLRTDFISSWEGDIELIEDISNLWSFTGASDGDSDPRPWNNATGNYMLSGDPSTLKSAIDALNDGIGDATYTEQNYITDGEDIVTSLDELDMAIHDLEAGTADKYVEETSNPISANTLHSLPYSIVYTPSSTAGREGQNMDVFVDGQLLAADTGANGANADRDYGETTTSGITFRFTIPANRNITYIVRA
jgi:hypothetical protein